MVSEGATKPMHDHLSFREAAEEVIKRQRIKQDSDSEAHRLLREKHSEHHQRVSDALPGISPPGATGVIYVTERAVTNGFKGNEDPNWSNFGQGAPEVGHLEGGSDRPKYIDLEAMGEDIHEYGPTSGVKELREAVANLYNHEYRQGKESKYTHENVCIVPGAGLTRVAAVIGDVLAAYQVPEYTAYDAMLSVFRRLVPIPSVLEETDHFKLDLASLKKSIKNQGVSVVVMSNPRNPTGQAIEGKELEELVAVAREGTTLVLDEFYSWYNHLGKLGESLSAGRYVEDVNEDPVILIDGLTKNWRLPGWRCCWVIGPKDLVQALGQSGSFLDGGATHPLQVAAIPLLEPERAMQDKIALQKHFRMKRQVVLDRLEKMGLKVKVEPTWTFYIWLDLSSLPEPLNNGLEWMPKGARHSDTGHLLRHQPVEAAEPGRQRLRIICPPVSLSLEAVAGRSIISRPNISTLCSSFGPPLPSLERGLDGIERVLQKAKKHGAQSMGKDHKAHHADGLTSEHGGAGA